MTVIKMKAYTYIEKDRFELLDKPQVLPLPDMYGKNLTFKTGGVDGCDCAEILSLIETGKIDTTSLITHSFPLSRIEELIKSCGLYKTKAKSLIEISKMLVTDFGGIVPDSIEQLTKLPGVGRKTANLICGDIYGKPAVVTDTHFIRIMNRLGLIDTDMPYKAEMQARAVLPIGDANAFCHRIVLHGRDTCTARRAFCDKCNLNEICKKKGVK